MIESVGKLPDQKHDPAWQRSFLTTRRPKLANLLAKQILDPIYFRALLEFCEILNRAWCRHSGLFTAVDEVEGALRAWADQACFQAQDPLELWLFPLLDSHVAKFIGWPKSGEAAIGIFPIPGEEDDQDLE